MDTQPRVYHALASRTPESIFKESRPQDRTKCPVFIIHVLQGATYLSRNVPHGHTLTFPFPFPSALTVQIIP